MSQLLRCWVTPAINKTRTLVGQPGLWRSLEPQECGFPPSSPMGSLPELVASAWMAGAWTSVQCDLWGLLELGAGGDAPSRVFFQPYVSLLAGWIFAPSLSTLPILPLKAAWTPFTWVLLSAEGHSRWRSPWHSAGADWLPPRRPALLGFLCVSSGTQSCLILCDAMDCSPPGSSVHGILQARILECVAIPFSRGSPWP